jgi:hypothetical protein
MLALHRQEMIANLNKGINQLKARKQDACHFLSMYSILSFQQVRNFIEKKGYTSMGKCHCKPKCKAQTKLPGSRYAQGHSPTSHTEEQIGKALESRAAFYRRHPITKATRKKLSDAAKRRRWPESHKQHLSEVGKERSYWQGKHLTEEMRQKISLSLKDWWKTRPEAPARRTFFRDRLRQTAKEITAYYDKTGFRGKWEHAFYLASTRQRIIVHYESHTLHWKDSRGRYRTYTPDFFIPKLNAFVELAGHKLKAKGRKEGSEKRGAKWWMKYADICKSNPDVLLYVFGERELHEWGCAPELEALGSKVSQYADFVGRKIIYPQLSRARIRVMLRNAQVKKDKRLK